MEWAAADRTDQRLIGIEGRVQRKLRAHPEDLAAMEIRVATGLAQGVEALHRGGATVGAEPDFARQFVERWRRDDLFGGGRGLLVASLGGPVLLVEDQPGRPVRIAMCVVRAQDVRAGLQRWVKPLVGEALTGSV